MTPFIGSFKMWTCAVIGHFSSPPVRMATPESHHHGDGDLCSDLNPKETVLEMWN